MATNAKIERKGDNLVITVKMNVKGKASSTGRSNILAINDGTFEDISDEAGEKNIGLKLIVMRKNKKAADDEDTSSKKKTTKKDDAKSSKNKTSTKKKGRDEEEEEDEND